MHNKNKNKDKYILFIVISLKQFQKRNIEMA